VKRKISHLLKSAGLERGLHLLMRMMSILPVKKNRVLFESFLGKQYSDNPRAIFEELRASRPELELIWSHDGTVRFPEGTQTVKRMTLRWIYLLATSRVWVSNSRLPSFLVKRKETTYLQTWHGTPLKRLALDMFDVQMANTTTERYKKDFQRESGKWDILVSPNPYSTSIFRRAFSFKGEVLEVGYPRNDLFYHPEKHPAILDKVKKHFQIGEGKKILLYAPTWRDDEYAEQGQYSFRLPFDLKAFEKRFGEDYVLLVRMHYLVGDRLDVSGVQSVRNASSYPDIAELYIASDALVTDYSSVMFDYAHLKRPMLFFAYDLEKYRDQLRGFYFDFEHDAPGPLLRTEEELFSAIAQLGAGDFDTAVAQRFRATFCHDDGTASARICERLF